MELHQAHIKDAGATRHHNLIMAKQTQLKHLSKDLDMASPYKTISLTIQDDWLQQAMYNRCHVSYEYDHGTRDMLQHAQQSVIREALVKANLIGEKALNITATDYQWSEDSITTSLYREQADQLRAKASELGVKVQQLMTDALHELFDGVLPEKMTLSITEA